MSVLGLKPWPEHAAERRSSNELQGRERHVGIGRTTRMLVMALEKASESHSRVDISGYSVNFTMQLVYRAREYAIRCGIDPTLIQPGEAGSVILDRIKKGDSNRPLRFPTFYDHYYPT